MSTGADCSIYEKQPGQWFYELQQYPYGECEDYKVYGPFDTYIASANHLALHHANPGGYSVAALPGCPHDLLVENDMPKGTFTCNRCGYFQIKPAPAKKQSKAKPRKRSLMRKSLRIIKLAGKNIHVMSDSPNARLVYGTRTHKWYMVGEGDMDYRTAITPAEFEQLGATRARDKYLSPSLV